MSLSNKELVTELCRIKRELKHSKDETRRANEILDNLGEMIERAMSYSPFPEMRWQAFYTQLTQNRWYE